MKIGGGKREAYVGSVLLATSKSTFVQCCGTAVTGGRKVRGIWGVRGVG